MQKSAASHSTNAVCAECGLFPREASNEIQKNIASTVTALSAAANDRRTLRKERALTLINIGAAPSGWVSLAPLFHAWIRLLTGVLAMQGIVESMMPSVAHLNGRCLESKFLGTARMLDIHSFV